jgi:hypothetical protein
MLRNKRSMSLLGCLGRAQVAFAAARHASRPLQAGIQSGHSYAAKHGTRNP